MNNIIYSDAPESYGIFDKNNFKKILFVCTEYFNHTIIILSMLPFINDKYPEAEITVICCEDTTELFIKCPFINKTISINREKANYDKIYLDKIKETLNTITYDLAINSSYYRDVLSDVIIMFSQAEIKIAFFHFKELTPLFFKIDRPSVRKLFNFDYTYLFYDEEEKPDLERYRNFLSIFGIKLANLLPDIWTKQEDQEFAQRFFLSENIKPKQAIAVFIGNKENINIYINCLDGLIQVAKMQSLKIIIFNNQTVCDFFKESYEGIININSTIITEVEILKLCSLSVSLNINPEVDILSVSEVIKVPHIFVASPLDLKNLNSGGHFTSIACLPLDCENCKKPCQYKYCISDIYSEVFAEIIKEVLNQTPVIPTLFTQGNLLCQVKYAKPKWQPFSFKTEFYKQTSFGVFRLYPLNKF